MSIYDKASLVLIPSGTKTSKVYSQVPTNGDGDFTFSRSTAATRVNASGNIEKETGNLLLQSNTFNTTWTTSNASVTSGQSGYDGSSDAWLLTATTSPALLYQNISGTSVYSFSLYAKANTQNSVFIRLTGGVNGRAFFDLQNGVVLGPTNVIDTSIEDVGNGWYRCTIVSSDTISDARIYVADNSQSLPSSGNIYIQDAQVEQGLVARDYIETTTTAIYGGITDNVPRLDYTDSSCPALLLEPQRRNILPHSEWFGDYNTLNGASITSNYSESPEGYQNATRLQLNAQSLSRIEYPVATGSAVQNERHSVSCWVKSNGGDTDFRLKCTHSGVLDYHSSNLTATSEWQRFTFTQLFGAGGGTTITAGILNGSSNNAADLSIYGLQLEDDGAGNGSSYATSYIPTYGSAVTRNADDTSLTGVSDLIGQTEGTMFFEGSVEHTPENVSIMNFDRSTQYSVSLLKASNDKINAFVYNGGSFLFNIVSTAISGRFKCAVAYKSGDTAFYVNGTQIGVNTTTFTPAATLDDIYIGSYLTPYFAYDHPVECNQALVFKTRLSNEELATLTTI